MHCESRNREICPLTEKEVEITVVVVAEIGCTCSVSLSDFETDCSFSEKCPHRRHPGCLMQSGIE